MMTLAAQVCALCVESMGAMQVLQSLGSVLLQAWTITPVVMAIASPLRGAGTGDSVLLPLVTFSPEPG
jgi:hypothetical protein